MRKARSEEEIKDVIISILEEVSPLSDLQIYDMIRVGGRRTKERKIAARVLHQMYSSGEVVVVGRKYSLPNE